jgi:hypothetical protein
MHGRWRAVAAADRGARHRLRCLACSGGVASRLAGLASQFLIDAYGVAHGGFRLLEAQQFYNSARAALVALHHRSPHALRATLISARAAFAG